jgi:hypothetical protein
MSTPPVAPAGLALGTASSIVETKVLTDTVQILQPGPEVLDPDSGEYKPGPDVVVYEGPGAVFAVGGSGLVLSLAGQAYSDNSARFKLFTPLGAPLASVGNSVRVSAARLDQGLLNRTWNVTRESDANSLTVVRTTWLNENTQTTSGSGS